MNVTDLNGTIPFYNENDNSQFNNTSTDSSQNDSTNTDIPAGGIVIPSWTNLPIDNNTDSSLNFLNDNSTQSETSSSTSDPISPVGARKRRMLQSLPKNFDWNLME